MPKHGDKLVRIFRDRISDDPEAKVEVKCTYIDSQNPVIQFYTIN